MGESFATILALNGAQVAVCDINRESANKVADAINSNWKKALAFKVDVSESTEVATVIKDISEKMGAPEILVNNAGLLKSTPFQDIIEAEWSSIMKVNVDGIFHCCKQVIPSMVRRKYGKIINISSTAGKSASTFGGMHYTASKAAVLGITRHLARELASFNINVNAVCPGSIDTPMVRSNATADQIKAGISKIPIGRLGTPEEVANLVLFLASDASSFITGASIDINGAELLV
jgi:NAD(P)-dependent dehydrogenase (short-subunit alcohol dehydrogenase family)